MQRTSIARGYILFYEHTLSVFVDGTHTNASPILPHMCACHHKVSMVNMFQRNIIGIL